MFCGNCGGEIKNSGGRFCPHCGAALNGGGNPGGERKPQQGRGDIIDEPVNPFHLKGNTELPMNWYKFVIYFQLFASALVNFGLGFSYMLGLRYGDGAASMVYAFYRGLKGVDIITGIMTWAVAAMAIVARQKMKNFKRDAVTWYLLILGGNIFISIFYLAAVRIVTGLNMAGESGQSIVSIFVSVVMIILCKIYFDKRKSLFVN